MKELREIKNQTAAHKAERKEIEAQIQKKLEEYKKQCKEDQKEFSELEKQISGVDCKEFDNK